MKTAQEYFLDNLAFSKHDFCVRPIVSVITHFKFRTQSILDLGLGAPLASHYLVFELCQDSHGKWYSGCSEVIMYILFQL